MAALSQSVHPRLRGELCQRIQRKMRYRGSSPLTRGTRESGRVCYLIARFIPAYAGNSKSKSRRCLFSSVHPRLRGELILFLIGCKIGIGSSPLTRGTQPQLFWSSGRLRFIPAYAGNSRLASGRILGKQGSSPLTRGTQTGPRGQTLRRRFIPAYAGNST